MIRFVFHVAAVFLMWVGLSTVISISLAHQFRSSVFYGLIVLGCVGGVWSSFQAYKKFFSK